MKTSPSPASEQRRPIFLRDWRVRSKLIAVLVIPAVAFLVLSSFGIGSLVRNAQAFDDGGRLADLGREVTALGVPSIKLRVTPPTPAFPEMV